MTTKQRPACLIVEAAAGDRRAANSLVKRAAKAAGLNGSFMSRAVSQSYDMRDARYLVDCTDEEFDRLMKIGGELAISEGWDRFPVDAYHD